MIEATDYTLLLDRFVVASFPLVQIYLQSTMHSDEPNGTLYISLIVSVTVIGQIDPYVLKLQELNSLYRPNQVKLDHLSPCRKVRESLADVIVIHSSQLV